MAVPFTIFSAALLAAALLMRLEWRRPNHQRRFSRVAATGLAVAALTALGVSAFSSQNPSTSATEASLFTPGVLPPGIHTDSVSNPRFALPGVAPLPSGMALLPDVALLRRQIPSLRTLHVYGDGLDPAELPALLGLRVVFHPPAPPPVSVVRPAIQFLHCLRELPLGEPLVIQGQVAGLAAGQTAELSLTAPDGASSEVFSATADHRGEAAFSLRAAALPATGRFLWHLRVGGVDLPLGVAIRPPALPRVLILEAAPHFDTAALRRWFGSAGGILVTRTQVGQDRFRFATAHGDSPPPFPALDARLLAGFDLVLTDVPALLALHSDEHAALLAAVRGAGLGLLTVADDTLLPLPSEASTLLPWTLAPIASGSVPVEEQSARLQWPGQIAPTDLPIPAAPFEIHLSAGQTALLTDHQGRTLAATRPQGRGQLALTLIRDTARWQRENDTAAFADYWSHLFSQLARPSANPGGRWSLPDGDAGPVFVDHPLSLVWSGPADHAPNAACVATDVATPVTSLALAPDPAEPALRHALFWPRQPGWHRVAVVPGAPGLDFYVHPAGSWPTLDAARRRLATASFAEASPAQEGKVPPREAAAAHAGPTGWFFAVFFLGAGYLWTERRWTAA